MPEAEEPRDFDDLMLRLEAAVAKPNLAAHEACLQSLGEVSHGGFSHGAAAALPLMHLSLGPSRQRRVLVIAGTHGDEPASVEAMLQLLEGFPTDYLNTASFDFLPCTNPTGWCQRTRENAAGIDVNWAFDRHDMPEVTILRHFLRWRRWEVIVDFHEDWEATGFYLYEHRRDADYIGPQVVDQVAEVCPLTAAAEIDGWPADHAVIHADDSVERLRRGDGLPLILLRDHTDHKVTTETPTCLPLQQRVEAHHRALTAILSHHLGSPD